MGKLKPALARVIPEPAKARLLRVRQYARHGQLRRSPVFAHAQAQNVFHCAVQRTASQWVKAWLSDERIHRYSGLVYYDTRVRGVSARPMTEWSYERPFPNGTIVGPLYFSREQYDSLDKPENHRAFAVIRDPRDIVVSHYFSSLYSHTPMGDIVPRRRVLQSLNRRQGLIYTIDYLSRFGLFDALASWGETAELDSRVLVVRYEELVGEYQYETARKVMLHCTIEMPSSELRSLLDDYQFERMRIRSQGATEPDVHSHYRSGTSRDWERHMDSELVSYLDEVSGGLAPRLGYV